MIFFMEPVVNITEEDVRSALSKVKDPELGMNIVDLGLIYAIHVKNGHDVEIEMTLTFPGCPFGPQILEQADEAVRQLQGVEAVLIDLVWNPMWTPKMIPQEVRDVMGIVIPE